MDKARIVAAVHDRGVVHRDINPSNVLIRPDESQLQLVNFGLATTFAEEHPGFEPAKRIHGNPAYLSCRHASATTCRRSASRASSCSA